MILEMVNVNIILSYLILIVTLNTFNFIIIIYLAMMEFLNKYLFPTYLAITIIPLFMTVVEHKLRLIFIKI